MGGGIVGGGGGERRAGIGRGEGGRLYGKIQLCEPIPIYPRYVTNFKEFLVLKIINYKV